jgi:conjugative relaxase-like TrwC/TraI family protein
MLTCSSISAAQAKNYYKLDDYYHEKGLVPSRVMGAAAERFGLGGTFDSEKFDAALHGILFCEPLDRANVPSLQRAGFDCTFSAPKSVSIEALVHGKSDVIQAHQDAVDAAMAEIQNLVRARVTQNFVTNAVSAQVAYFNFRHETSRNIKNELPDPNLHDHNVILGQVLVRTADGKEKIYSLDNKEIFRAQKMLDMVYKQVLAERLRALGYELELTKTGFEIAGYSREQIEVFSKRKNAVDKNLADRGLSREESTIKQRDVANMKDRNKKRTFSRHEMRLAWNQQNKPFKTPERKNGSERYLTATEAWSAELRRASHRSIALGFRRRSINAEPSLSPARRKAPPTRRGCMRDLSAINVVHHARRGEMLLQGDVQLHLDDVRTDRSSTLRRVDGRGGRLTADDAVAVAIRHFGERSVAIRNRYELAEFAMKAAEFDFPLQDIQKAIDVAIATGDLVLGKNGQALVLAAAHADEQSIAMLYGAGIGAVSGAATLAAASIGIRKMEAAMTDRRLAEARTAANRPLHENECDHLKVLLSSKQVEMIERIATSTDRYILIEGDAGTGKSTGMEAAKLILETHGFTVRGLAPSGTAVQALAEAGLNTKTVQHAYHNPKYWDDVDENTALVLDEAGLVDARTMRYVQERVAERGARLVIVGDPKQYGSVNRGSAMTQLCDLADRAGMLVNLDQMQRGRNETMRELHFAARDTPEASLDLMFKNHMVTAIADDRMRLDRIAEMYIEIDARDKKSALVLTGKNADRIKINSAIRSKIGLQGGMLIRSLEMVDATAEATKMLATYERGDFIKLNRKLEAWRSGTMLQVVEKLPDAMVVRDRNGLEKRIHPRVFAGMASVGQVEQIEIAVGERVRFTSADPVRQILNGDRGEVSRIDAGAMFIKLDRTGADVSVELDQDTPLQLRYAYAQTGHSAQGATARVLDPKLKIPNVILCTNADDVTVDAKSWYTNVTRAADHIHLVTNATTARQIEFVRDRISTTRVRDTAQDLLDGEQRLQQIRLRKTYIAPATGARAWERVEIPAHAKPTEIADLLRLAHAQYGRNLFVSGAKAIQTSIAKIAGREGLDVSFDDKALEAVRRQSRLPIHNAPEAAASIRNEHYSEAASATVPVLVDEIFDRLPRETELKILKINKGNVHLVECEGGRHFTVVLTDEVKNMFKVAQLREGASFELNSKSTSLTVSKHEHVHPLTQR